MNFYQARLTWSPTGVLKVSARKTAAGVDTILGNEYTSIATSTSDYFWFRGQISGTTSVNLKLRVWKDGTTEPGNWTVDATDASPPAGLQGTGHFGARFSSSGSYTGSTPITNSWDDLSFTTIGGGGGTLGTDDYVSRATFDPLGQQLSSSTPTTPGITGTAMTSTSTYDELGALRSSADVTGLVSASVFDRASRALTTYQDPPTSAAFIDGQMTYDADGKLLTSMDRRQAAAAPGYALGRTSNSYDGLGRETSVIEAQGSSPDVAAETRTTYDGLDRTIATEVGYGAASSQLTSQTLDLGGRATATDDGFTCTTATYDYRDLVLTTTDALDTSTCASNTGSRTVSNSYDGMGRLYQAEITAGPDNGDRPTIATFDAVGNALTTGKRQGGTTTTTTFTRTRLDQVVTAARPDGSTAKATFDPAGNLVDACTWASGTPGNCLPVGGDDGSTKPTNSTSTRWDARNGRIGLTYADNNVNYTRTTFFDPNHAYQPSAIYQPTIGDGTKEHQVLVTTWDALDRPDGDHPAAVHDFERPFVQFFHHDRLGYLFL